MTFRELEIFYALSENNHTLEVAKKLNLSQSAISLSIKSLEKKLEVRLFDRIGKKLILNSNGKQFKTQTYSHFLALKESENLFKNSEISGILNISASKTTGNYFLPKIFFEFLSKYPKVKFQKTIENSTDIIQKVLNGNIDIGFIETEFENKNIIKKTIAQDRLIIVSSDKNLTKKSFYIDELFDKKWILRESGSGTREMFLNKLEILQKEINIFIETNEFEEIKNLLKLSKDTITTISEFVVQEEIKRKELFEVKVKNFEFKRNFYMIYHKDKYKTTLFKSLEEFLFSE